jgi:carboxypeptidase C (cathepsin A)
MRVDIFRFAKELLKNQRRTVGRFDSRFKGIESDIAADRIEYDPSAEAIFGAFTSTFNHYVKTDLKWEKDAEYKILTNVRPWKYGVENQYLNVSDRLRNVMTKNGYLRTFVGSSYYDLATPFFATDYTFDHLGMDPTLQNHITTKIYQGGHMMYIYRPSLIMLKKDLADFYRETLAVQLQEEVESSSVQR